MIYINFFSYSLFSRLSTS